mgnify:CR=1 FL=1
MKRKLFLAVVILALATPVFAQGVTATTTVSGSNDVNTVNTGGSAATIQGSRPTATAPAVVLTSTGSSNCLGSASGSAGNGFFSIGGGTTVESVPCNRRLNSERLQNLGLRNSAIALMCLDEDVARVTPECKQLVPPAKKTGRIAVLDGKDTYDPYVCARSGERCRE